MTNSWINTQAGNRFAFHTIPRLTDAVKRIGDILAGMQEDPYGEEITPETVRDAFRDMKMKEREHIYRIVSWEPTQLEILLYRALSRLHQEASGDSLEMTTTLDEALSEAFDALSIASHDFRNALAIHTYCIDGNERDEWEYKGDDRSP